MKFMNLHTPPESPDLSLNPDMGYPPLPPSSKLRLMCSYGGHIVPRLNDKSFLYAGGDTRIVSVDRCTTAASFFAHLSRFLFNNRPFHLKYQLPNEDLDSLISVVTDEDLVNMLEENDRITPPARIRLFLFPVKPESLGSTLLDPKSESWFSDALKNTRIMQSSEAPFDTGSKLGAESCVLETSSSFGSTGSSFSISNSPPVGIDPCEDNGGLNLLESKIRVPSSASIESENSIGGASSPPRAGMLHQPLIQVSPEAPSFLPKSQSTICDPSISIPTQNMVHVLRYPLTQQPDGKQLQQETPVIQGGMHNLPQYPATPMPMSPYYPVYQLPMHQQTNPCSQNQPYPIYLVPVRPTQYHNMPMQCNIIDTNNTNSASRPPLHPQTATIPPNIAHEIVRSQAVAESVTNVYRTIPACASPVNVPSNQSQLVTGIPEPLNLSKPVTPDSVVSATQSNDFNDDIAYSQIFKSQPSASVLASQYQAITNGIDLMLSESSVQVRPNHAKEQATLHL